ncbi:MAG: polyisoprenoid-binding protein [Deltaproteobacteria bacterium]|nr:MAG: polyisoprenoid-binding protein [Deltaproteobacteria bacterium]
MKRILLVSSLVVFLGIPILASGATYQIDPAHSNFQFKIRHMTVSNVKGEFKKVTGVVALDDNDITGLKVEVTLDTASVNTDHAKRDEHLRTADFFDATKYPTITFVSKKVLKVDASRLKVVGDLTLRGITKEITVDVEGPTPEVKDPGGNFRRGATGEAKINRKDFGMVWHKVLDNGGLVVGDDVAISVEIELVRK